VEEMKASAELAAAIPRPAPGRQFASTTELGLAVRRTASTRDFPATATYEKARPGSAGHEDSRRPFRQVGVPLTNRTKELLWRSDPKPEMAEAVWNPRSGRGGSREQAAIRHTGTAQIVPAALLTAITGTGNNCHVRGSRPRGDAAAQPWPWLC